MLYGISGGIGYGKTALGVLMLYKAHRQGRPTFANINTSFAQKLTGEELMSMERLPPNSCVLLDELYAWLDSRLSGKRTNVALSHIILQSRKRNFDIIYTVQLFATVDLRVRRNTEVAITAIAPFRYILLDSRHYPPKLLRFTWRNPYIVFDKYDTREIVYPIERDEDKK
jgi:hypothetical protein